ncbi:MAG: LysM peptidoglycan-binding domain-containing protein [Sulfurovum sp.]|nr:LysM peptidoglycan-binding domain-containing protein [Sulfurovum sp.]
MRQANGLKKSDVLKFGKVLKVPTNVYTANKKATISSKYVIKKGDTLSGIAVKHHTSVKMIRDANGLKKSDAIKIGKVLKVPTKAYVLKSKVVTKPTTYVIKSGDTLSGIARKHHTTVSEIRKANGLKKSETIKIGKVLKVPQKKKAIRYTKTKQKPASKKLVASLAYLDSISLETAKEKNPAKFSFSDIFVSSKKDENADKYKKITSLAKTKLGKRYVWGASGTRNTYDCSSFTKYVYRNVGVTIPRTSIRQSKFGKYVKRDELQKGDLVFFDTSKRRKGYVNHVGIYLGDNKFIHASSAKKKVVITSLNKNFYSNRYKGARRPS